MRSRQRIPATIGRWSKGGGPRLPTSLAKVFNATLSTGTGQSTETFTTARAVPAESASGIYSATLTVTIVSGR